MERQRQARWDEAGTSWKAKALSKVLRTRPVFQSAMWAQMPLLAMAGPRFREVSAERCELVLPFGWRTKNIFGTMYFGASLMAAEATTGGLVLCRGAAADDISYIVTGVSADFVDKAQSEVTFRCEQGQEVAQAFEEARRRSDRFEREFQVVGEREDGVQTAQVTVRWSFRGRSA